MLSLQQLIISLIAISAVLSVGTAALEAAQVFQQPLRSLTFPLHPTFSQILVTCLAPKQIYYFTTVLTDVPVIVPLQDAGPVYFVIPFEDPIP